MVEYSAGMTKKIGLACALIHAPRLLILDEPFEAVDPVSGEGIRSILRNYARSGGTVVMSSHVMELVESLCDELAVVAQGRVLAGGTLDDVRAGSSLQQRFLELVGFHARGRGVAGVVAILVRLKLTLLRNSLRRSVWRTVGLIIGMVYALGIVVAVLIGMVGAAVHLARADRRRDGVGLLGADARLAADVAVGLRDRRDGRSGQVRTAARAGPGVAARTVWSPGWSAYRGSRSILVALGLIITWARTLPLMLAAVVAVPLGLATCFLLSRAATAAFASFLSSRRFRDLAFVALALFGASMGIGGNLIGTLVSTDVDETARQSR